MFHHSCDNVSNMFHLVLVSYLLWVSVTQMSSCALVFLQFMWQCCSVTLFQEAAKAVLNFAGTGSGIIDAFLY